MAFSFFLIFVLADREIVPIEIHGGPARSNSGMRLTKCLVYGGLLTFLMAAQLPALAQSQLIRANITGGDGDGK